MVIPGATTRTDLVKRRDRPRAALSACQAMSMAMTVVLPAPVASLNATRSMSGLGSAGTTASLGRWTIAFASASRSRNQRPVLPLLGATSVSQIAASTASSWQKNGRIWRVSSAWIARQ